METIIAAIIGGIFAILAARIGRRQSRSTEPEQAVSEIKHVEEPRELSSSSIGKVLYFLIATSPVSIPIASVVLFQVPGEFAAGGRYRYGEALPVVSAASLIILGVAIFGLWKTTAGIFRLRCGRVFTPKGLFRTGLFGLLLAFLMDNVLQETILRIIYGSRY
jgi:hypothetical protein